METKRLVLLLATMLFILGLTACTRPASTPPPDEAATPTTVGEYPIPGVTDDVMGQLESFATQTAQAQLAGTPQSSPTASAPTEGAPAETLEAPDTSQPTSVPEEVVPESTPFPVPTATPGLPETYTLQKGEFPYCIARRLDVNPNELLRESGLAGGGTYSTGTVLVIPKSGRDFPGNRTLKAHPTTVVVKTDDTIYSIACEFGDVEPYAIAAANGLSEPYNITSGQNLHIP